MINVVVIGDVHGNARALRAALDQAQHGPTDHIVFVGDLLSYGHDVREVLDLIDETQQRDNATLLVGNHDQMYLDLARGERSYFDGLPDWIKHSVDKTLELLDATAFRDRLRWSHEVAFERVLIAHANPFGTGDWTYLNAAAEHARSAQTIEQRGLRGGVFGHTHRARWYVGNDASAGEDVELGVTLHAPSTTALVANAGAVGQPRDRRGSSVILRLSIDTNQIDGVFERVDYDVQAHVESLRSAGLPPATTERLCAFFKNAS